MRFLIQAIKRFFSKPQPLPQSGPRRFLTGPPTYRVLDDDSPQIPQQQIEKWIRRFDRVVSSKWGSALRVGWSIRGNQIIFEIRTANEYLQPLSRWFGGQLDGGKLFHTVSLSAA